MDDLIPLMTDEDLIDELRQFSGATRQAVDDVCPARDEDRPVVLDEDERREDS